jgi:hypothetical protein
LPDIIAAARKHPKDLEVLGIDVDEDAGTVQSYAQSNGIPYELLLDSGSVFRKYKGSGVPYHVFINRKGEITTKVSGTITPSRLEQEIQKAMAS